MSNIESKVCIIGAGPAGLLTYDYLTKYNIQTIIFESSYNYGGQCTAFYANKNVNGIPGLYNTNSSEFIKTIYNQCINKDNLILNANVNVIDIKNDLFYLANNNDIYTCTYLVLATGAGSMKPIIPNINGIENFINNKDFVQFYCNDFTQYRNKNVVIAGGGDSAVDYAIEISKIANNVVLLHRRDKLKCDQNKLNLLNNVDLKLNQHILEIRKNLIITDNEEIKTNNVIFCYGFTYNNNFLKQLSNFGLILDNNLVQVNLISMETSIKSCYAIGDVVKYPMKKKNIISCCFESERVVKTILNKESLYNFN